MKSSVKLFFLFLIASSCHSPAQLTTSTYQATPNIALVYKNAVMDAMYPDTNKIDNNLLAITSDNKNLIRDTFNREEYIKVITWKDSDYYHCTNKDTC